jgi:hypothetical protein
MGRVSEIFVQTLADLLDRRKTLAQRGFAGYIVTE